MGDARRKKTDMAARCARDRERGYITSVHRLHVECCITKESAMKISMKIHCIRIIWHNLAPSQWKLRNSVNYPRISLFFANMKKKLGYGVPHFAARHISARAQCEFFANTENSQFTPIITNSWRAIYSRFVLQLPVLPFLAKNGPQDQPIAWIIETFLLLLLNFSRLVTKDGCRTEYFLVWLRMSYAPSCKTARFGRVDYEYSSSWTGPMNEVGSMRRWMVDCAQRWIRWQLQFDLKTKIVVWTFFTDVVFNFFLIGMKMITDAVQTGKSPHIHIWVPWYCTSQKNGVIYLA